jgi:aminobenzoyl-glutamate transport protein
VRRAPLIAFLIILVGGLSSVASDAGYLILISLAAAAFVSLKRNPIAGLAAGFAGSRRRCSQHHHPADRRDARGNDQ